MNKPEGKPSNGHVATDVPGRLDSAASPESTPRLCVSSDETDFTTPRGTPAEELHMRNTLERNLDRRLQRPTAAAFEVPTTLPSSSTVSEQPRAKSRVDSPNLLELSTQQLELSTLFKMNSERAARLLRAQAAMQDSNGSSDIQRHLEAEIAELRVMMEVSQRELLGVIGCSQEDWLEVQRMEEHLQQLLVHEHAGADLVRRELQFNNATHEGMMQQQQAELDQLNGELMRLRREEEEQQQHTDNERNGLHRLIEHERCATVNQREQTAALQEQVPVTDRQSSLGVPSRCCSALFLDPFNSPWPVCVCSCFICTRLNSLVALSLPCC